MSTMLACGPYFDDDGIVISWVIFLVIKPLAYFAFIQAFRYRVARAIPMSYRRAAGLTAWRAACGVAIALLSLAIMSSGTNELAIIGIGLFYLLRILAWWWIGSAGAGLRGRRLVGWIVSGSLINAAFDISLAGGFIEGWIAPVVGVSVIFAFIWILHAVGRRDQLKQLFSDSPVCRKCGYNLTGNLSGRCPECGHALETAELAFASNDR